MTQQEFLDALTAMLPQCKVAAFCDVVNEQEQSCIETLLVLRMQTVCGSLTIEVGGLFAKVLAGIVNDGAAKHVVEHFAKMIQEATDKAVQVRLDIETNCPECKTETVN